MTEIRITYEILFDLLRKEKNREEIQVLDPDFYEQVLAYLNEKKSLLTKKGDDLFISAEREKLKNQFQNIRRIVKELYEKREKKILTLAMNKVRTGSDIIDTSSLLPSEKRFFDEASDLFSRYKEEVLHSILFLKESSNGSEQQATASGSRSELASAGVPPGLEAQRIERKVVQLSSSAAESSAVLTDESGAQQAGEKASRKKIKLSTSLPRFVGRKGEVLGPYTAGEIAEVDSDIADLLVSKHKAELA